MFFVFVHDFNRKNYSDYQSYGSLDKKYCLFDTLKGIILPIAQPFFAKN